MDRRVVASALRALSSALATIRVVAARKLPSSDVALYASTTASAEVLRVYTREWLEAFSPSTTM